MPPPRAPCVVFNGVGRCLGTHCVLVGVGGSRHCRLLHTRVHGKSSVYSIIQTLMLYSSLASNHASPELYSLYSIIQHYTALYIIQLYSLYSIQRYTITLWDNDDDDDDCCYSPSC